MNIYIYIYIYIYTHTHIYIHIFTHIYIYTYHLNERSIRQHVHTQAHEPLLRVRLRRYAKFLKLGVRRDGRKGGDMSA